MSYGEENNFNIEIVLTRIYKSKFTKRQANN